MRSESVPRQTCPEDILPLSFWVVIAGDSLFEGMLVGWLAGVLDFFIPKSGNVSIRGPPSPRSFPLTLSVGQTLTTSGGDNYAHLRHPNNFPFLRDNLRGG